jgi:hypothetical protein
MDVDVAWIEKPHYDLSRLASGVVGFLCGNNILQPQPAFFIYIGATCRFSMSTTG